MCERLINSIPGALAYVLYLRAFGQAGGLQVMPGARAPVLIRRWWLMPPTLRHADQRGTEHVLE